MGSFLIHINELLRRNVILASSFISYVLPNQWAHSSFISMSFLLHITRLTHSRRWCMNELIDACKSTLSCIWHPPRVWHVCDMYVTQIIHTVWSWRDRDVTVTWLIQNATSPVYDFISAPELSMCVCVSENVHVSFCVRACACVYECVV